jgi:DNA ligase-1
VERSVVTLFKCMLASAIEDTSTLKFPVLASIKLDGIRATVQGGQLLSRNLKPIPNKRVQEKFKDLPEGLDGELIYGDPVDEHAFRNTTSIVMSHDKPADAIAFHAFDRYNVDDARPFSSRFNEVLTVVYTSDVIDVVHVPHKIIDNEEELLEFEADALEAGHEGIMVRSLSGPYKQGQSSVKEGHLLKLKRFKDAEAKITGFVEEQENTNEAKTNALGRTERSSKKEGMVAKGTLGKFEVMGVNGDYKDVEFRVGGGFTALMRQEFWTNRKKLIGKIICYKYFPTGSVDRPRFPVFKSFRDKRDM